MELIRKKEYSLKSVFLKFIVQIVLSWFLVAAIDVLLLTSLIMLGIILPANTVEQATTNWIAQFDASETVLPNTLPAGADYACFSPDGELLWTNLKEDTLEKATLLASSETETNQYISSNRTYLKVSSETQTLILSYQIRATFSSPALRRIFPSAEPFLLILLSLLFFVDLLFFILHYAKKLEKELLLLQHASDQIRARNLDFESKRTHIAEFNRVLDSLLLLKEELKISLEDQWQMQQQKKEQISALAHDIKTPLTIVKGNAQLLQESNLDEEQQEYNSFILENTEQIQTYVTRMLEVSRAGQSSGSNTASHTGSNTASHTVAHTERSGVAASHSEHSQTSGLVSCNLSHLLTHIEKNAKNLCLEKNLSFMLDATDLPLSVPFPEDSLKRALMNLIDNAVQYSPVNGTMILRAGQTPASAHDSGTIYFSVSDEGCGFTNKALIHATDEFYRSDESRGNREHFGMGLAITKQIVTELGGTLSLANRDNGGAIVTIRITVG